MIVLDASAATDFLLELGPEGEWVASQIADAESLQAPHLIDLEVAAALRRLVHRGEIAAARGRRGLDLLAGLPLTRYPALAVLDRIWELRASLTVYDANYVALAEALDAPLVTTDRRLSRVPGHRARVEAFPGRDA